MAIGYDLVSTGNGVGTLLFEALGYTIFVETDFREHQNE